MMSSKYSRVCAEIDMDAIAENFRVMHEAIRPETKMVAVIKTDGYGHGAVPIAQMIQPEDYIWGFAVATMTEAMILRKNQITKPVLILGYTFEEDYEDLIRYEIRPVVFKLDMTKKLSQAAIQLKKTLSIHIGLDTGMSRIGFSDTEESIETIREIASLPGIKIEGMFTHFAKADELDKTSANRQFERYMHFAHRLEEAGVVIPLKHVSNSAALMELADMNLNLVRAGISIYGIYPSAEVSRDSMKLTPAMSLRSRIVYIKEIETGTQISYGGTFTATHPMKIATIPVGYGDGYPRMLSNKGCVLIHGKRAKILGRICMDQFMVDVTDIPEAKELDEVILVGRQGNEEITVDELGDLCGRFSYEFICDIGKRVPRIYTKNHEVYLVRDCSGID
ncbi:MAG: alanine racemase [Lachnospiraceae bacterium]